MKKLFIICPECYIEQCIRQSFEECFFVTALGSVCSILDERFWHEVDDFIDREGIKEAYIVGDFYCGFIDSTLKLKPETNTDAEKRLSKIMLSLNDEASMDNKKIALCKANIIESAQSWLKQSQLMTERVSKGGVGLKGLLFDRSKQSFSTMPVSE